MNETVDVFEDGLLASIYDDLNPWVANDDFYLGLAQESGGAVLDLGCGTGRLACRIARASLAPRAWYGDWDRSAGTPASKEVIAVTGRAD